MSKIPEAAIESAINQEHAIYDLLNASGEIMATLGVLPDSVQDGRIQIIDIEITRINSVVQNIWRLLKEMKPNHPKEAIARKCREIVEEAKIGMMGFGSLAATAVYMNTLAEGNIITDKDA